MKEVLSIFALMLFNILSYSSSYTVNDPRIPKIDALMNEQYQAGHFTGGVLVAENGNVIYKKTFGLANREHSVPNDFKTKFRIGSITKQFTASAIMVLQQQGKLSVHDTIRQYLPDYPEIGDKITIHHLLTHTSGIPEYTNIDDFWSLQTHPCSLPELVNLFKDKPLDFKPGSQWSYSNSGYVLLAQIIENITGTSYEKFLNQALFEPAQITDTLEDRALKIIPHRAQGYGLLPNKKIQNAQYIDLSCTKAAGSLLSTMEDLYKWDRVLYQNTILNEVSKSQMFYDQTGTGYGYGWAVDEKFGHRRVSHGGAINGFLSEFSRYIGADVTIIVWNNTIFEEPNHKLPDALARIMFG
ncbi:Penicillin-binding protein E [Legionella pneumophila]|uniref:serine hydrolase domain-containing protein n=1 Tax=Legionella pneumophila TaxID=446 RepID=UPI0007709B82|nr:serine hydrolase domain-containing protein [Legionella pneumophila]CZG39808.1 Penicillin-binding protein E [Legionella pneumophila]CZH40798.1 Penicillin-binding protein E [Legionella pneumophila]